MASEKSHIPRSWLQQNADKENWTECGSTNDFKSPAIYKSYKSMTTIMCL